MASAPPQFPPPGTLKAKVMNRLIGLNTVAYRLSGGRVGGKISGGDVMLLHHVGRKSGEERCAPVMYARDGDDLVVIASRGGSDASPAWYLNLKANPRTTVEIGRERIEVEAKDAPESERDRLWAIALANYPHFDEYQTRTTRQIPVLVLSPVGN